MPSSSATSNYGKPWNRDELILAFELYCRIPFQQTKATNPEVRKLARMLHRSPASVARKLGNFGAFDPELKKRNISGLGHASKLDRAVWNEFHDDWNGLVLKAHDLRMNLAPEAEALETEIQVPTGPSEVLRLVKQRIHQSFFRQTVVSSYHCTCCITGLTIAECLTASHIVPWSVKEELRTDPSNGLCLSATFDRLFDAGLITVTQELAVKVSSRLLRTRSGPTADLICCFQDRPIVRPHRFLPAAAHLEWHRSNVFLD